MHVSTCDAVFTTIDGQKVRMEFHPYCGPAFFIGEQDIYHTEDTPYWDHIWNQFNGWWKAKGKAKYSRKDK